MVKVNNSVSIFDFKQINVSWKVSYKWDLTSMLPFYLFCWLWIGVSSLDRAQPIFTCTKWTIRTSEHHVKYVIDVFMVSLLLILNMSHTLCRCVGLLNLNKKISAGKSVGNLIKSNFVCIGLYWNYILFAIFLHKQISSNNQFFEIWVEVLTLNQIAGFLN